MKVCFSARRVYDDASKLIAYELLNKYDIEPYFVVNNNKEKNNILSTIPKAKIFNISDLVKRFWDSNYDLEELEKKYEMIPLWRYIYSDRFLVNCSYDYIVKTTKALILSYEFIFKDGFDFYYDETIATLQSYIAFFVGKKYGAKYVSQMVARGFDTTHHYFLTDPFQHIDGFDPNWINKNFSEKTREKAIAFLDNYRKKTEMPGLMKTVKSKPNFGIGAFITGLKRFFNPIYHNKYDYIDYKSYKELLRKPLYWFRYQRYKKYYRIPDFSKKYIYFPLHYQPEASTLVCAEKYEKQLYYIDSIAKSLKANEFLYVKEHYALIGHRPISFYKELSKYKNVVIINPSVASSELIMNSLAVTTLTGTAGWEAMLLGKKVILGGSIYFDNAPGVIKIEDAYDQFCSSLESTLETPTKETIINYLCEYLENIYKGCVYFCEKEYLVADNIRNVSESLYHFLKKQWNQLVEKN